MRYSSNERRLYRQNLLLMEWVRNLDSEVSVAKYLQNENIDKVAIYGMADLGELLLNHLKKNGISVVYAIDKRSEHMRYEDIEVISISDARNRNEDIVIVTAMMDISNLLHEMPKKNIVTLENIIYEMGCKKTG